MDCWIGWIGLFTVDTGKECSLEIFQLFALILNIDASNHFQSVTTTWTFVVK